MSMKKDIYDVTGHPIPFDISCTIKNIMLPMRDGIKLHTAVYFPPELRKKAGSCWCVRLITGRRSSFRPMPEP